MDGNLGLLSLPLLQGFLLLLFFSFTTGVGRGPLTALAEPGTK